MKKKKEQTLNLNTQYYKGIPLNVINRNYDGYNAKRFVINHTNQNIWIPNKHLLPDGTIKDGENLDYIFAKAKRQNKLLYSNVNNGCYGVGSKACLEICGGCHED